MLQKASIIKQKDKIQRKYNLQNTCLIKDIKPRIHKELWGAEEALSD